MSGIYSSFDPHVTDWVALRTSAKWEKSLATQLIEAGYAIYLPTITRLTRYKTRKSTAVVPMFSGYVFAERRIADELGKVPRCASRIAQVLVPDDAVKLRQELAWVAELQRNYGFVQEIVFGAVGSKVRLRRGQFSGMDATVVRNLPDKHRMTLAVSFLGLEIAVEVWDSDVEREFVTTTP